jgi:hypothetical protein
MERTQFNDYDSDDYKIVNSNFKVDQYNNVYDDDGIYYAKWHMLSDAEKKEVKKNPMSFY